MCFGFKHWIRQSNGDLKYSNVTTTRCMFNYFHYFWMFMVIFDDLLHGLQQDLRCKDTTIRKSISPKEKLTNTPKVRKKVSLIELVYI